MQRTSVWAGALLGAVTIGAAQADEARPYGAVVAATAGMVHDREAQRLAALHGLRVLNVTWEDTGRSKGSSMGPNISDMTIQVAQRDPRSGRVHLTCMPVIRAPNFEDVTADLPIDRFRVLVGNERGLPLRDVPLKDVLSNLRHHLSEPLSWKGPRRSLLAERDTHVLVSAQACFLPVPRDGAAEFNPVLFNYQSYAENPAVLTILVTRQGTSVTVIDNTRDGFSDGRAMGQRLFFNQAGQRASLTGQRQSDFERTPAAAHATNPVAVGGEAGGGGLNQVLLIQVPLKQKPRPRRQAYAPGCADGMELMAGAPAAAERRRGGSDVEEAVIGHGEVEGPFTELADLEVERDERFPIRVTVQFYKATSNGVVSPGDMESIAGQLRAVYADATAVGSLVTRGYTGRVTEHDATPHGHPAWWDAFWTRHEQATGQPREEALRALRALVGEGWTPSSEAALRDALVLAQATRPAPVRQPLHAPEFCGTGEREPDRRSAAGLLFVGLLAGGLLAGGLRFMR
ncbi:MAG: hypothetical protein M9894_10275 [Planctomycetes bacterium]|nr:hypothetical protein [Planctomycetota bacterium]